MRRRRRVEIVAALALAIGAAEAARAQRASFSTSARLYEKTEIITSRPGL